MTTDHRPRRFSAKDNKEINFQKISELPTTDQMAFVFPGQGSQYIGMGKDLYETHSIVRETFGLAEEILKNDSQLPPKSDKEIHFQKTSESLSKLCFEGPEEELNRTINTQVAVFTLDWAIFLLLKEKGIIPQIVAGHSLGEYAALTAAEVIDFSEGLRLVKKRADLMEEAAKKAPGKMLAILGLEAEIVKEVLRPLKNKGIVGIANYNCPGQIVISGETALLDRAKEVFQDVGAKKVVELKVSGGFHSSLMEEAQEKLGKLLAEVEFKPAAIPVISNFTGKTATDPRRIKEALRNQITGSVQWEQSVKEMLREGAALFVEVGPGRILSGLIKRITPQHSLFNVESLQTFNKFLWYIGKNSVVAPSG